MSKKVLMSKKVFWLLVTLLGVIATVFSLLIIIGLVKLAIYVYQHWSLVKEDWNKYATMRAAGIVVGVTILSLSFLGSIKRWLKKLKSRRRRYA